MITPQANSNTWVKINSRPLYYPPPTSRSIKSDTLLWPWDTKHKHSWCLEVQRFKEAVYGDYWRPKRRHVTVGEKRLRVATPQQCFRHIIRKALSNRPSTIYRRNCSCEVPRAWTPPLKSSSYRSSNEQCLLAIASAAAVETASNKRVNHVENWRLRAITQRRIVEDVLGSRKPRCVSIIPHLWQGQDREQPKALYKILSVFQHARPTKWLSLVDLLKAVWLQLFVRT